METVVYLYASKRKIQLKPIAIPDARSKGTCFFIFKNGICCFVKSKKTAIKSVAKTARYKANSPDETEIFLTKMPSVPNMVIEAINIKREFTSFFLLSQHINLFINLFYFALCAAKLRPSFYIVVFASWNNMHMGIYFLQQSDNDEWFLQHNPFHQSFFAFLTNAQNIYQLKTPEIPIR